jgi:hypothetical protein
MSEPQKNQALSLLQGILDETAAEAEQAKVALEEEIKRKEAEAKAAAQAEEARRREEIASRLREEEERQRIAAERREHALEELRIEELKAKGLWKEPEPETAPPVADTAAGAPGPSTQSLVAVQERSRRSVGLAAAAAVLAIGAGAAGVWFYLNQEYVDATTPFASATPAVVELASASTVVAFQAIPDPIVQEAAAAPEPARPATRPSRPRTSGSSTPEPAEPSGPRLNLGGNLGDR